MMLCKVNLSRMERAYRHRKCFLSRASVSAIDVQTTRKDETRSSRLALPRLLLRHGKAVVRRVGGRTTAARPEQERATLCQRLPRSRKKQERRFRGLH